MASMPQPELFSWEHVAALGDLKRLQLLLSVIPDEAVTQHLEALGSHGRNDYPVRAIWNSVLAGVHANDRNSNTNAVFPVRRVTSLIGSAVN